MKEQDFKLEKAFEEIEEIVKKMEEKDISLEESFDLYTKGCKLLGKCNEQIDGIEKKIMILEE